MAEFDVVPPWEAARTRVAMDVARQEKAQIDKWGLQKHTYREWRAILLEELAEHECRVVAGKRSGYGELVHVAAVVLAWLTDLRLREEADDAG